ncbi:MAG TPA: hypothetical protein VF235_07405 [Actinomycetota bacterium]
MIERTNLARWTIRLSAFLLGLAGAGAIGFGLMLGLIAEGFGELHDAVGEILVSVLLGTLAIVTGVEVWRRSPAWRFVGMTLALLGLYLAISWIVSGEQDLGGSLLLGIPPAFVFVGLGLTGSHFHHRSDRPAHAGPGRGAPAIPGAIA